MNVVNEKSIREILIDGPAGQQELLVESPEAARATTCVVCHPHPVYGGTMHNKVVYTLASTMHALKVKTVRFNFRGVQKSEGKFDDGIGELEDVKNVVRWVREHYPDDDLWLAGFSFGAYVALKTASLCDAKQLIIVAPPVGQPYFQHIPLITCPWIVVQGEQDEIIDSVKVIAWAESQIPAPKITVMPEVGHFFHGQLLVLKQNIMDLLCSYASS